MKILIAALLSLALIRLAPAEPPKHFKNLVQQKHPAAKTVAVAAQATVPTEPAAPVAIPEPQTMTLSHEELMTQAGISQKNWPAVDYIISHESGWNPEATEPNSGAHGLPQALPYSKTGCGWSDSLCQLQWANDYAVARYGGWWAAQAYWVNHRNW